MKLDEINQKIVDAIVRKAEKVCPGSLALIGVYGSVCTGDVHEKSDLDLMILINDDGSCRTALFWMTGRLGMTFTVRTGKCLRRRRNADMHIWQS